VKIVESPNTAVVGASRLERGNSRIIQAAGNCLLTNFYGHDCTRSPATCTASFVESLSLRSDQIFNFASRSIRA